ncbi:MAG TPA: hypothetical protein DCZ92_04110 [Elusimicrobia bacterium]|nr:MAG: hypothetical protein A2016_10245 [Elusimicrobia bacterium GWF2_62_30]HBA60001.1 hypothetical protein [Elusimicrobiota bacterium]
MEIDSAGAGQARDYFFYNIMYLKGTRTSPPAAQAPRGFNMAELHYLQVTRECNQKCRFCSNPASDSTISLRAAKRLIDGYARIKAAGVIFTGGEPTLHPELDKLIAYARLRKLPARITTNGQKAAASGYLAGLKAAGLEHIHFSAYSHSAAVHDYLTRKKGSHEKLLRAIGNAGALGLRTDINMVINRLNSRHLHLAVENLSKQFPFVAHFVFNNMDPGMDRVVEDPSTIPVLSDFEASLAKAMRYLDSTGRTFRVERVPLCFMAEFPHCSTETRKIVTGEGRNTYFLDEKRMVKQKVWEHGKSDRCAVCGLSGICAGLYKMDVYYSSAELCPVFPDPEPIKRRILQG